LITEMQVRSLSRGTRKDVMAYISKSSGYVIECGHEGHPLVGARGRVRQHRLVLWDKLKGENSECYWCKRIVFWFSLPLLVVDHLDKDKTNNNASNLVASCIRCNAHRDEIPVGLRHGTLDGYNRYKCRCALCKEARRQYRINYYKRTSK
jgi:hypothetical protein